MAANPFFAALHRPRRHCDKTLLAFHGTLCAANVSRGHSEFFTRLHGWFSFTRVNHEFQSGQKGGLRNTWNVEWVGTTRFLCINLHGGNWKEGSFEFFNRLIFHLENWKLLFVCLILDYLFIFFFSQYFEFTIFSIGKYKVEWFYGIIMEFKNSGQNWAVTMSFWIM